MKNDTQSNLSIWIVTECYYESQVRVQSSSLNQIKMWISILAPRGKRQKRKVPAFRIKEVLQAQLLTIERPELDNKD